MLIERKALMDQLFPVGMPKLLCPPLTHFSGPMAVDTARMEAHYRAMSARVGAFLIPGSTGDGWLMDDEMMLDVLRLGCKHALRYGGGILAAVLKPELPDMLQGIRKVQDMVEAQTGRRDTHGFVDAGLKGITVCAPKGAERAQGEIKDALRTVLDLGLPTALYQLPQMTDNEIGPEVFEHLAAAYPNFYLFKDTSGGDRVAQSGVDTHGVYLVRGAEGGYARWYKGSGGPYDGFLLSTANAFSNELTRVIALADAGRADEAAALSDTLDSLVAELFALVEPIQVSNAFASSARIADHLRAYGAAADAAKAPLLPDGTRMPQDILSTGITRIRGAGIDVKSGYLV